MTQQLTTRPRGLANGDLDEVRISSAAIRIVVVGHNKSYRKPLWSLIQKTPGMEIAGVARDADEALHQIRVHDPKVALIDTEVTGSDGVELTKTIKTMHPEVEVVGVTAHRGDEHLHEMLLAGARAYVLEDGDGRSMTEAISAAARGESWLSPPMTAKLIDWYLRSPSAAVRERLDQDARLTRREYSVLASVAHGRTNREIANELLISETTVRTHLRNVFAKLSVRNRSEAAALAWRRGLASYPNID